MPFQNVDSTVVTYSNNTQSRTYDYNLSRSPNTNPVYGVSVQPVYTDTTPGAKSFVAADVTVDPANTITITGHGFFTGLEAVLSGTNLPTGLSATTYYIIVVDANTIQLATTLAHALAGTAVVISAQGTTADAALTPGALSQVVKLQASNDGTNFTDVASKTVTVSASGNVVWDLGTPFYRILRVVVTPTTGSMTLVLNFNGVNLS